MGYALITIAVAACAGDGTGLDEFGNPLASVVITVSDTIVSLPVGAMLGLTAEVRDLQGSLLADQAVTWASTNAGIASIDAGGLLVAVARGEVTVTAAKLDGVETIRVSVVSSATLSGNVQPIFNTAGCVNSGCHSGAQPQMGQNLTAGNAFANIVGVPSAELPSMARVEPGNPERSYLVHKVQGTHLVVGGSGAQMPLGLGMLPQGDIDIIRAWIRAGAANN